MFNWATDSPLSPVSDQTTWFRYLYRLEQKDSTCSLIVVLPGVIVWLGTVPGTMKWPYLSVLNLFNVIFGWEHNGDLKTSTRAYVACTYFYPIHTEIFAPKSNEINFIPVRDCWLLIGRMVFVTSEKYRPTNHRPRTALCH